MRDALPYRIRLSGRAIALVVLTKGGNDQRVLLSRCQVDAQ